MWFLKRGTVAEIITKVVSIYPLLLWVGDVFGFFVLDEITKQYFTIQYMPKK